MSWYRNHIGIWCACFQRYQPETIPGTGCPAYGCPEAPLPTELAGIDPK